ncbi:transposase [Arthrobacter sp. Hiyo1]|uniref:transposase n=1 Tax=Arthrobacter sp. Hiyo1 TaxID=1588020 RepID=UPI000A0636FD
MGEQLGVNPEALRTWVSRAEIDEGLRPGTTSDDAVRLAELEREVRELRRANTILRQSAVFFAAELCATRRCVCRGAVRDRPGWVVAAA